MPPPDGNFEDYVSLSQDTLYQYGAEIDLGGSSASTVQIVLSNSAGALALAATATGNATDWMPINGGTLITNINLSAGTTSLNLSRVTFSNANGVSFGFPANSVVGMHSVITASINQGAINLSAGTTSNTLTAVTFSNDNGISFGLNASTVTASVSGLASLNVSAGTTSQNLSSLVFSNTVVMGNASLSWGLSGSTLTANIVATNTLAIGAGANTAEYGVIFLSNSNNISFGIRTSIGGNYLVTASTFTQVGQITAVNLSAGTTSSNVSAVTLSNSHGVSFGFDGTNVTANAGLNLSAGTTSNVLAAVTFSNSNGVSFGLNGSTVTASYAGLNISGGTTSNLLSQIVLSNSNGLSFGLNGSVVTAQNGGISSWQNGNLFNLFNVASNNISVQPVIIENGLTATQAVLLLSITNVSTNSSGGLAIKFYVYTLSNSTLLAAASTLNSNLTWTSGAPYSSVSGVNYLGIPLASWAFTPGPYVVGIGISGLNSASLSAYGIMSSASIAQGAGPPVITLILPGFVTGSVAASSSINVTNTGQYIRNGVSALQQPWFVLQGT